MRLDFIFLVLIKRKACSSTARCMDKHVHNQGCKSSWDPRDSWDFNTFFGISWDLKILKFPGYLNSNKKFTARSKTRKHGNARKRSETLGNTRKRSETKITKTRKRSEMLGNTRKPTKNYKSTSKPTLLNE